MALRAFGGNKGLRYGFSAQESVSQFSPDDPQGYVGRSYSQPKLEWIGPDSDGEGWKELTDNPLVAPYFGPSEFLSLDAALMAKPSHSKSRFPVVDRHGGNLASVLSFMALNRPDDFERIQDSLRSIVPSVKRIRFDRIETFEINPETIRIDDEQITRFRREQVVAERILFDTQGAADIPANLASEGTLLVLGLLTVLLGPNQPRLILLDDLDHGLHPKAQRDLVGLLRTFLAEKPDTQFVVTTHSPYLLDELEPEEIRLTTLNDDGSAACAALVDHPDFDRWKDEMTPGEMWSLFGEKWAAARGA